MNFASAIGIARRPMKVWRVTLVYALVAGLWIGLSDAAVTWLIKDPWQRALAETLNGWLFIGASAGLLHGLMRRLFDRQQKAFDGERAALQRHDETLRLLEAIAANSPDVIFAKDREGRYLLFNREAARVAGTDVDRVLGQDDRAVFAPEQAAMIRANDERVMTQGEPRTFEEELDTADGRVTFMATKGALHASDGSVVGMFGIARDITARLAAQARLRESEQRYRLLFEENPQPMWVYDCATLHFLAVNDAAVLHYGYPRDAFLAMTVVGIEPRSAAGGPDPTPPGPSDGIEYEPTLLHQHRDGHLIEVETKSNALTLNGRPAQLVLVRDVTQRREFERQRQLAHASVAAAHALLRDVLARVEDGFLALDNAYRYTFVNRRAALLLGFETPEHLVGRHIWTEFPQIVGSPFQKACEQAMSGQHVVDVDVYFGQARRWLAGRLYPSPAGLSIYFSDITERKQAEAGLRASEDRYRMLFDCNPMPMWLCDLESLRFLAVNDAAVSQYGYSRDEFMAMNITDLRPASERLRLTNWIASTKAADVDGLQQAGTWIHQRKDGRQLDVDVSLSRVVLDGRPASLVMARDITVHRELERQRQTAHDQLSVVLSRVDDGLVALDSDWRYTYVSEPAARMLGREKPEDLLGRHIWTEYPDGIGQPFHRAYEQAMATQRPVVVEDHYQPWDLWFENRIYPSADGLSIYFSDITLRKRAELGLRVNEQRYRLAASGGQVWDWNAVTDEVDFPAAFWQQLGYASVPAQDCTARLAAVMHPDDVPCWRQALRDHLLRRAAYDLDYRARHVDGEWRWFHTQGQAVWDAAGRATYMAGTTFDITERKRAEAALRESEAYRRSLFEQLGDGVLLVDREERILDVNPYALKMLGYTREEALRLVVRDVLLKVEHDRVDDDVQKVLSGQPHLAEWYFLRKDGSQFVAEASARQLDEQRFVAVIRDITARRESERALLTYQLELSELAQQLLSQEKSTTQRVAQALHDHLGQTLAVARLNLDACLSIHQATMPEALHEQGRQIARLLDQAVREVRQVLVDLRPPLLDDLGLTAALDNEVTWRGAASGGADVLLEVVDAASGRRWPAPVEYGAFMVAREAIANAHQHARSSLIRVLIDGNERSLSMDVIDDGNGIPAPVQHGRPGHLGIVGMRERSIAIGARFSVDQMAGGGTRVSLRWERRGP